jgi:hypothetical protein
VGSHNHLDAVPTGPFDIKLRLTALDEQNCFILGEAALAASRINTANFSYALILVVFNPTHYSVSCH